MNSSFEHQTGPAGSSSLGVDIGSRSVKALLARYASAGTIIEAAGSFEVAPGTVIDGVVTNPKLFGKTLAKYLAHTGAAASTAVFSVPSSLAVLRWLMLPELPIDELREAARYKVKRHLPIPVESAYIEVAPPAPGVDAPSLVIAVPRNILDSRAEALLHAHLVPVAAELEAQSILRMMEQHLKLRSALWRDASLTVIDIGGGSTHMYVVQNQRLQFIRGVKFGASMFHDAVARELDLEPDRTHQLLSQADATLDSDGFLRIPFEGDIAIVNVSQELEKLTREFLRLMRYFRSLHPERSYAGILDHAVLCGGIVGLAGLEAHLEKTLGLRVERARPIAGLMTRFSSETFAAVSHRQEAFTIAMGLAMAGLGGSGTSAAEVTAEREFAWQRAG